MTTKRKAPPFRRGLIYLDSRDSMGCLMHEGEQQIGAIRDHLNTLFRGQGLKTEQDYARAQVEITIRQLLDRVEQNCRIVAYKLEQISEERQHTEET